MFDVALPTRHPKRLLEATEEYQEDSRVPFAEYNPQKRIRHISSPSNRCGVPHLNGQAHSFSIGSSTVAAIRALFPEMNDKVISDVLAEYGDNIDAAIRHLNDLQLSAPGTSKQHAIQGQQRQGIIGPSSSSSPRDPDHLHGADATTKSTDPSANQPQQATKSADEWIELLVREMAAAGDVADAKLRASNVLQSFEQAVLEHSRSTNERTAEVERENALLKRAVAIQNARLREVTSKEVEIQDTKIALEATKSRVQALEMQNYALQLHLKQASDTRDALLSFGPPKNPDVF